MVAAWERTADDVTVQIHGSIFSLEAHDFDRIEIFCLTFTVCLLNPFQLQLLD